MKLSRVLLFEVSFIIVVLVLSVVFVSGDPRLSASQGIRFLSTGVGDSSNQVMMNRTWSISAGNILKERLSYDGRDASVISINLAVRSVGTEGVLIIVLNGCTVAKLGITKTSVISCIDSSYKSRDILSCAGNSDSSQQGNGAIGAPSNQTVHIVATSSCGFDIINRNLTNEISFISSYEGVFSFSINW